MGDNGPFTPHRQYHSSLRHGGASSQGISSNVVDQFIAEYSCFSPSRVIISWDVFWRMYWIISLHRMVLRNQWAQGPIQSLTQFLSLVNMESHVKTRMFKMAGQNP